MSKVVPQQRDLMIQFYEYHSPIWTANAAGVGLLPAQTTELATRLEKAKNSLDAVLAARQQAKALTLQLDADAAALRSYGAGLMSTIRGYAEQQADPAETYVLAEIPAPQPAKPAGPPVAPEAVVADPNATGTITLKIKGSVAQNASFHIERSIDGGPYLLVGPTRLKTWTDEAVPMNSNTIQYRVFGVRDDTRSQTATTATVNFGNLPPALQAAFRSGPVAEAA